MHVTQFQRECFKIEPREKQITADMFDDCLLVRRVTVLAQTMQDGCVTKNNQIEANVT